MIGIGIGIKHERPPGVSTPGFLISEDGTLYLETESGDFIVDEATGTDESGDGGDPVVSTIEGLSLDIFNPDRAGEVGIYRPLILNGEYVYGDKLSQSGMLYPFGTNMIFHRYNEVDAKHTYIYWDRSTQDYRWRVSSSTAVPEDVLGSAGIGYAPTSQITALKPDSVLYGDGVGSRPADLLNPGQNDSYSISTEMVEPYPDGEWVMPQ